MRLHIFNPDHDLALAANLANYTAPHAGRELRADLGFLPALWAENGDWVLVDDLESTALYTRHMGQYLHQVRYLTFDELSRSYVQPSEICVWGWNKSLRRQLLRHGVEERLMPSDEYIELYRQFSSRQWAAEHLLAPLVRSHPQLLGEAVCCRKVPHLQPHTVLKSPWSSSGRGVRYVERADDSALRRWAENIVRQQGAVMQEPYYKKVRDFAMEFECTADRRVEYLGLSLFQTVRGAYTGNLIATEEEKTKELGQYVDSGLLQHLRHEIITLISSHIAPHYVGPLGIDMMIVSHPQAGDSFMVHPCVEMNLRRTMGHVALALTPRQPQPWRIMRIKYTDRYRLQVSPYLENIVNNALI